MVDAIIEPEGFTLPSNFSVRERQERLKAFLEYEKARRQLAQELASKNAARITLEEGGRPVAIVERLKPEEQVEVERMAVRFLFAVPHEQRTEFRDNVYFVILDLNNQGNYSHGDPYTFWATGTDCNVRSSDFRALQWQMPTDVLSEGVSRLVQAPAGNIRVT